MVATDYDPLALGYIASLARPGGNVTGVFMQQIELTPKRLEFLTQAVPELARVVALWDRYSADQFEAAREAARSLRIRLDGIECVDPPYDYERLLAGVEGGDRDVMLQMTSPVFIEDRYGRFEHDLRPAGSDQIDSAAHQLRCHCPKAIRIGGVQLQIVDLQVAAHLPAEHTQLLYERLYPGTGPCRGEYAKAQEFRRLAGCCCSERR
jgi:hypothetical protein